MMAKALETRGVKVIRQMVPPLGEIDKKFDAVVMINLMEHMDTMAAALQLSKEIHEVLKPGGRVVICSPDYINWRCHFFAGDFTHNYVTTMQRLKGLLISSGFEDIHGIYLSGFFSGLFCYFLSSLASILPFGIFERLFSDSKFCHKLYKMQLTFLRKVLIVAAKR